MLATSLSAVRKSMTEGKSSPRGLVMLVTALGKPWVVMLVTAFLVSSLPNLSHHAIVTEANKVCSRLALYSLTPACA
jgi:hypothetical protein